MFSSGLDQVGGLPATSVHLFRALVAVSLIFILRLRLNRFLDIPVPKAFWQFPGRKEFKFWDIPSRYLSTTHRFSSRNGQGIMVKSTRYSWGSEMGFPYLGQSGKGDYQQAIGSRVFEGPNAECRSCFRLPENAVDAVRGETQEPSRHYPCRVYSEGVGSFQSQSGMRSQANAC